MTECRSAINYHAGLICAAAGALHGDCKRAEIKALEHEIQAILREVTA